MVTISVPLATAGTAREDVAEIVAVQETSGPEAEPGLVEFKHVVVPAQGCYLGVLRQSLRRWLTGHRLSEEAVSTLVLAVNEATTNAVLHAYRSADTGSIDLTFWVEPGAVCVEVCDHGHWRLPSNEPVKPGHGVSLMRHCVDAVLIDRGSRGTRVHLWQALRTSSVPVQRPAPDTLSLAAPDRAADRADGSNRGATRAPRRAGGS